MAGSTPSPEAQTDLLQQSTDPLAQLRDIHAPGVLDAWPPALGWWLIATLCLLITIAALIWLLRVWSSNRYRREALRELNNFFTIWDKDKDDHAYLQSLQNLLKRTALTAFPRELVAGLTGEAWVQFLDQTTDRNDFRIGKGEALIDRGYHADFSVDVASLHSLAKKWIEKHFWRH